MRQRGLLIITGGGRGIGAATARHAGGQGWSLCIAYRSDATSAEALVEECRRAGVAAVATRADVSVEADVERLFASTPTELGPVRGLVNNAGIVEPRTTVAEMTADRIRRMFAINSVGPFLCAREAVRRMSTTAGGSGGVIVNVSSRAAVLGSPGEYVDYAASKAALDALTVGLAREVADQGIRVNGVRPGLIDTDIHEPGRLDRLRATVPIKRVGTVDEVAAAIVWLLSTEATYVTGATLDVSGGR